MREKNGNINTSAEKMLSQINEMIDNKISKTNAMEGAIVTKVNEDGTVNVKVPPDNTVFTKISNQTPFSLKVGDSVELLRKNGQYNNCWVVAKHQTSNSNSQQEDAIRAIVKQVLLEYGLISNI